MDTPKVGLLEVGDVCVVKEARLNEARTTRIQLAEPGVNLPSHAGVSNANSGRRTAGVGSLRCGSMYLAPGERWASATMTDGTLSVEPLIEMQCTKRIQLRSGFGVTSVPLRCLPSQHMQALQ